MEVIRRAAGLDEAEVKTALATLADKGVVKVVGRALFLQLWQVEVMLASVFPYVHVSPTKAGRVQLMLRPDAINA